MNLSSPKDIGKPCILAPAGPRHPMSGFMLLPLYEWSKPLLSGPAICSGDRSSFAGNPLCPGKHCNHVDKTWSGDQSPQEGLKGRSFIKPVFYFKIARSDRKGPSRMHCLSCANSAKCEMFAFGAGSICLSNWDVTKENRYDPLFSQRVITVWGCRAKRGGFLFGWDFLSSLQSLVNAILGESNQYIWWLCYNMILYPEGEKFSRKKTWFPISPHVLEDKDHLFFEDQVSEQLYLHTAHFYSRIFILHAHWSLLLCLLQLLSAFLKMATSYFAVKL